MQRVLSLLARWSSTIRPPVLVAIDGLSSSGKSTLAAELRAARPDLSVIAMDDFYGPMDAREMSALGPEEGYDRYFDWERLREEVLVPLTRGLTARYRRYDWGRHRLGGWTEIEPEGLVVVEGVYSTRPELRDLFRFSIFVETGRDERTGRSMARAEAEFGSKAIDNVAARRADHRFWLQRWMAAEEWYDHHIDPKQWADVVLSGSGP